MQAEPAMMARMFVVPVPAIIALAVLTFLAAGVALLVVGLVKKRTGMWVSGIVMLALFVVLAVAIPLVGMLVAFRRSTAQWASSTWSKVAAEQTVLLEFESRTGVETPADTTCLGSARLLNEHRGETLYLKLQVSDAVETILEEHFEQVSWDDVRDEMTAPEGMAEQVGFWNTSEMEGARCYRRTYTGGTGTAYDSCVTYDGESGMVYFVSRVASD